MPSKGSFKEINQKQFESLCFIQCSEEEICSVLEVSDKTLNSWCKRVYGLSFYEIYKIKSNGGKMSLRRTIWTQAQKGNVACLLFLCKNVIGMADNPADKSVQETSQQLGEKITEENNRLIKAISDRKVDGVD